MRWPPENPTRIALISVIVAFVAGSVAILATGASLANFGSLMMGCVALGAILATFLDRSRGAQAAKR